MKRMCRVGLNLSLRCRLLRSLLGTSSARMSVWDLFELRMPIVWVPRPPATTIARPMTARLVVSTMTRLAVTVTIGLMPLGDFLASWGRQRLMQYYVVTLLAGLPPRMWLRPVSASAMSFPSRPPSRLRALGSTT